MWYAVCPNNVHLISMKDELIIKEALCGIFLMLTLGDYLPRYWTVYLTFFHQLPPPPPIIFHSESFFSTIAFELFLVYAAAD